MTPPAEFAQGVEKPLEDWSAWGLQKFSGLLDYAKTITVEKPGKGMSLDLGKVCSRRRGLGEREKLRRPALGPARIRRRGGPASRPERDPGPRRQPDQQQLRRDRGVGPLRPRADRPGPLIREEEHGDETEPGRGAAAPGHERREGDGPDDGGDGPSLWPGRRAAHRSRPNRARPRRREGAHRGAARRRPGRSPRRGPRDRPRVPEAAEDRPLGRQDRALGGKDQEEALERACRKEDPRP